MRCGAIIGNETVDRCFLVESVSLSSNSKSGMAARSLLREVFREDTAPAKAKHAAGERLGVVFNGVQRRLR
ncbi:hypothetical protein CKO42_04675 [Lamprobacter modestohalophilus]|uniref:Uncharacterized protein n=1 Tax=Lamprobacter modestohalophilus TaxID=1064514 RepID=A0A9X1B3A5_9GAMM|nr:hypothetical protein [Lamprobacter modestohalophilus]